MAYQDNSAVVLELICNGDDVTVVFGDGRMVKLIPYLPVRGRATGLGRFVLISERQVVVSYTRRVSDAGGDEYSFKLVAVGYTSDLVSYYLEAINSYVTAFLYAASHGGGDVYYLHHLLCSCRDDLSHMVSKINQAAASSPT